MESTMFKSYWLIKLYLQNKELMKNNEDQNAAFTKAE